MKKNVLTAAAALVLLAAGCSTDEPQMASNDSDDPEQTTSARVQAGPVWFFGTVHKVPDNGGVWIVRTVSGTQYQPTSLPEEYQVEGLDVEVHAQKHDQVMTKDTIGQGIDIVDIEKR